MKDYYKRLLLAVMLFFFSCIAFAQTRQHIVQRGETIVTIAEHYGVSFAQLFELNPELVTKGVRVGSVVLIPINESQENSTTQAEENTSHEVKTQMEEVPEKNAPEKKETNVRQEDSQQSLPASPVTIEHQVARGETLDSIAERYGITMEDILNHNPQANSFVYVGMKLAIPVVSIEPEEVVAAIPSSTTQPEPSSSQPVTQPASSSFAGGTLSIGFGYHYLIPLINGDFRYRGGIGFIEEIGYCSPSKLGIFSGIDFAIVNVNPKSPGHTTSNILTVPLQLGYGVAGDSFGIRAGGLVGMDWANTTYYTYDSGHEKSNDISNSAFFYGLGLSARFGALEIGFRLTWTEEQDKPGKMLAFGLFF